MLLCNVRLVPPYRTRVPCIRDRVGQIPLHHMTRPPIPAVQIKDDNKRHLEHRQPTRASYPNRARNNVHASTASGHDAFVSLLGFRRGGGGARRALGAVGSGLLARGPGTPVVFQCARPRLCHASAASAAVAVLFLALLLVVVFDSQFEFVHPGAGLLAAGELRDVRANAAAFHRG